ncbi:MAG TPA: helix-turn-helix domain-containing protein [Gaiellaceae bacterium]|nr:helix-turn-helix domain-containing protein [Gaiellaceae bacterium]
MPKVSEEHLEARRAQILDGARRAFATYGYDGATVARLEEETGLSRGAIFHYYAGKQELFIALALDLSARYVALLVDRGLNDAVRAMANEDPELLGVLMEIQGRLRHDEEFQRRMDEGNADRDRLVEWFAERQRDGTFRDDVELIHLGRFATMVLNGLALRVAGGDDTDVEPIIRLLHDALGPRK